MDNKIKYIQNYLRDDFESRCKVLKSLGFIDENYQLNSSGKILKEITIMELVITEIVMRNLFELLDVEEIVAVIASLTSRGDRNNPFKLIHNPIKNELRAISK